FREFLPRYNPPYSNRFRPAGRSGVQNRNCCATTVRGRERQLATKLPAQRRWPLALSATRPGKSSAVQRAPENPTSRSDMDRSEELASQAGLQKEIHSQRPAAEQRYTHTRRDSEARPWESVQLAAKNSAPVIARCCRTAR